MPKDEAKQTEQVKPEAKAPAVLDKVTVDLEAEGDCWLEASADGKELFAGILHAKESKHFEAKDKLIVKYGNIGVVRIKVNGEAVDLKGEHGVAVKTYLRNAPAQPAAAAKAEEAAPQPKPEAKAAPAAGGGAGLDLLPWPKVDFAKFGPVERKDLSRIKKISGANLHRNWVMIPHVTNNDVADITELEAFRVQTNAEQAKAKSDVKVTMLAFVIKAVVAALKKFPEFNASLDGDTLVYKQYYNIGFAADTPNGLVVPCLLYTSPSPRD